MVGAGAGMGMPAAGEIDQRFYPDDGDYHQDEEQGECQKNGI
jgi:hypothetical protein